jgi:hypothetical protein
MKQSKMNVGFRVFYSYIYYLCRGLEKRNGKGIYEIGLGLTKNSVGMENGIESLREGQKSIHIVYMLSARREVDMDET